MRIITGTARGKRLLALEGLETRPTADRVKESLFNILQFRLEGRRFLDLFAGSGQIGLEALSRGAKDVVFVEKSRKAADIVRKNIENVGFAEKAELLCTDYAAYLRGTGRVFDIAFLDPPYQQGLLEPALLAVCEKMAVSGIIICEHTAREIVPQQAGEFVKGKTYRYGKIVLTSYEHVSMLQESGK